MHLNDYHNLPSTTSACFPEFISTYSSTCTMHHHTPPLHATVHQCPPTNLLPLTPARLVTLHLQGICIITWNNNSTCRRKWFQTPIHPAVNSLAIPFQDFSLKIFFDGITMEKTIWCIHFPDGDIILFYLFIPKQIFDLEFFLLQ